MRKTTKKLSPFGEIIKQYLLKEGKKQGELAKEIGVSSQYLTHVIYGAFTPSAPTAKKICTATQTPLSEAYRILFGESE